MEQESITEGWVKFTRRYFSDNGYIDRWMGDCVNNPNRPTKASIQLNSFSVFYRLNTGEWVDDSELFKMDLHWQMIDLPATLIWQNCYDDYKAVLLQNSLPSGPGQTSE